LNLAGIRAKIRKHQNLCNRQWSDCVHIHVYIYIYTFACITYTCIYTYTCTAYSRTRSCDESSYMYGHLFVCMYI
jgi:hypothetical protein